MQARHLQVQYPGTNSAVIGTFFPADMSPYKLVKRGRLNRCLATLDERVDDARCRRRPRQPLAAGELLAPWQE
jgi:hypothetical protein